MHDNPSMKFSVFSLAAEQFGLEERAEAVVRRLTANTVNEHTPRQLRQTISSRSRIRQIIMWIFLMTIKLRNWVAKYFGVNVAAFDMTGTMMTEIGRAHV